MLLILFLLRMFPHYIQKNVLRNVNNKVSDYEFNLQNEIHKCCTHSFDNYFEKNEKTKTKCKICGYVLI